MYKLNPPIEWGVPAEIMQMILSLASEEKLGPLLENRRICKQFDHNVKGLLASRWNSFSACKDGEFKNSLIEKTIIEINQTSNAHSFVKFQIFAQKLGILPNDLSLNQAGLQKIFAENIEIIWKNELRDVLLEIYDFIDDPIPELNAKAFDIINFLNSYTFKEIKSLDFCKLDLRMFPSQILDCFPNINTLRLSNNSIRALQLKSKTLKTLCLYNNQFTDIPNVNCPNLHTLALANNKIKRLNYPKGCCKLVELILDNNQIEQFGLCSPTLGILELYGNPLTQINELICPQLHSLGVSSYPFCSAGSETEQPIQLKGRLHCPQLPPGEIKRLTIDIQAFENAYKLTKEKHELAIQTICEKRLSQLVFETHQIENEQPTWDLESLLGTFCLATALSNFKEITELDLRNLNLDVFPMRLLQYLPDLKVLDLRNNPIENLEDLENYPDLIVLFGEQN